MADFEKFLPILLKHEGGYVNDPLDPGGETNRGITMMTFQACAPKLLGIAPTSENLKVLTRKQAGIIYRELYWDKIRGDEYELQELANVVCDFYVNAGVNATKLLQNILREFGYNVTADGHIGSETMEALGHSSEADVYHAFKKGRIAYYQSLGGKYPQYLAGWLNRANSFKDLEDA